MGEHVTEYNEHFCGLHSPSAPHQRMPAEMLADAYRYMIEMGNQGVYKDLVHYIGMRDRTPTLKQHMKHLATLDTFLINSQPASGSNTNLTQLRKLQLGKWTSTQVVKLAQLARPKMMV